MRIEHHKRFGEDWNDLAYKGTPLQAVLDPLGDDRKNNAMDASHKDFILQILNPQGTEKVLDFGCGIGRISEFLAPYVKEIIAIDTSPNMIKRAKELQKSSNVIYECKRLDEVKEKFDVILDIGVSCFFPEKLKEATYKLFKKLAPRALVSSDFGDGKFNISEIRR